MDSPQAAELEALYARVSDLLAQERPVCQMSGVCCDFPNTDHELWSSGLEVDYARATAGGAVPRVDSGLCPWHVDGVCAHRTGRPLGCRLYFCDPKWADRMPEVYELFHAELKALHDRFGLDYTYQRFVDAVRDPGGPPALAASEPPAKAALASPPNAAPESPPTPSEPSSSS
jgi:hypothetical protein